MTQINVETVILKKMLSIFYYAAANMNEKEYNQRRQSERLIGNGVFWGLFGTRGEGVTDTRRSLFTVGGGIHLKAFCVRH